MKFYSRNGKLYIAINKDGKRLRKATGLEDSTKNRKLVENSLQKDLLLNNFGISNNKALLVKEYLDNIMIQKESTVKGTSLHSYNSICKTRINPYFGDKLVTSIKPIDIKNWQDSLVKVKLSNSTINSARSLLCEVFDIAILEEVITTNPVSAIKLPKNRSSYEMNPLTLSEIQLLLNNSNGMLHNYIGVACFTGLRCGELFGLRWEDINLTDMTITVKRTITNGFIQTPKTESSKRTIEILNTCKQYLINQRLLTGLKKGYVFLSPKDKIIKSSSCLNRQWKEVLNKSKLCYRNIYQTRHTFASLMLNNNEELLWVSSMLGHKDGSITLKKYSKFIRNKSIKRASFLDEWHKTDTIAV